MKISVTITVLVYKKFKDFGSNNFKEFSVSEPDVFRMVLPPTFPVVSFYCFKPLVELTERITRSELIETDLVETYMVLMTLYPIRLENVRQIKIKPSVIKSNVTSKG